MMSDCGCDYAACDMVSPTAIKLWQMLACKNVLHLRNSSQSIYPFIIKSGHLQERHFYSYQVIDI